MSTDAALALERFDPESGDLAEWLRVIRLSFGDQRPSPEDWIASRRRHYAGQRLSAVRDGRRIVGTYRSWDTTLTVPGGAVTADAISSVTVLPTHRRRGALSTMIGADLADAADRGIPVAVLVASEAPIYGRYGFGPATESATWTLDVARARLRPEAAALADDLVLEIADDERMELDGPEVYERSRRPGDIDRWPHWWATAAGRSPEDPHDTGPGVTVLARHPAAGVQGLLRYRSAPEWVERDPRTTAEVVALLAATPSAYAALWRHLADLDLVATVRAEDRPVDEALPWLLTDPRAARQRSRADLLWTRVLDPAALLAARRYERPGTAVLEVRDPRGWAAGRFALEVAADGTATCARTAAPADVELPVEVLGAVWLGGADLTRLALGGLAAESRSGGLTRCAGLLRTTTAPYSSTWF